MKIKFALFVIQCLLVLNSVAQTSAVTITSPGKKLQVRVSVNADKQINYTILNNNQVVLKPSRLGLLMADEDFAKDLQLLNASPVEIIKDSYELFTGKRKLNRYTANKKVVHFSNSNGKKMDIIFQVSDDGVAFRYFFPGTSTDLKQVTEEITTYHFDASSRAFLQPMSVAKSGWEQTNPAYEEHYKQDMPVGTPAPTEAGWVYPALFKQGNTWLLITEAALDGTYCASRLKQESPKGEYSLGFPGEKEVIVKNGLLPQSHLPFYSPWRIITIGNLKTIAESTLGTDVAKPAAKTDQAFIKPGKSTWSWIMSKDDFIVYDEQKKYIDFAADMHWQYCLIDVAWDTKIGYDKIKELADYAAKKNVGLLLWYNSAGDWNTVKYTPKGMLLTHESRVKEFGRLKSMGIKGVKIDFFGGDGRSVIQYYIDILKDAGDFGLMVNFHGATLPRGWQRTYPQLITAEAIRGFEMITFGQADADAQANHCAMLPFTRNAFDPMDFTPMNLYKIPTNSIRKTTSGFELALSVLFLSGIQHFAESPDGMSHVPEYVKDFLRELPVRWDDVRFIEGYPGKYVVLARRAGNKWYITGINGENSAKEIKLDLSVFSKKKTTIITDGTEALSFTASQEQVKSKAAKQIKMQPNGGFVLILE